jgi:hypothetical protein
VDDLGLWQKRDEWVLWILLEVADTDEDAPIEEVEREEDDGKGHPGEQ